MVKNPIGNGWVGTKTSTQQSALRAAETLTKMRLGYPLQKTLHPFPPAPYGANHGVEKWLRILGYLRTSPKVGEDLTRARQWPKISGILSSCRSRFRSSVSPTGSKRWASL